jgi:cobalt/nickel transport system permease protein
MHIAEGVLSTPVLISGAAATATVTVIGLAKMSYEEIPKVSVLTSAFFIASLIRLPIGPASEHLILNGLMGIVLGWSAFPAILVALILQCILFQYGGITTLGVNTFSMAAPAVICYYLFRKPIGSFRISVAAFFGFITGLLGVLIAGIFVATALILSQSSFERPAYMIVIAHIPIMIVEGLLTAAVVSSLRKTKPEIFRNE